MAARVGDAKDIIIAFLISAIISFIVGAYYGNSTHKDTTYRIHITDTITRPTNNTPTQPTSVTQPKIVDVEQLAKEFIYFKESSNNPAAVNSNGCYGLGQDCNDILRHECPDWRTNVECQDKFWTGYMERRYGSWVKAKAHWLAAVPINGKYVGNWW